MVIRKVQKVGRSTYTVSLPHDWVEARNLAPKTEVDIQALPDGSLRVSTLELLKGESRTSEIVIRSKEPDAGYLIRRALAAYISNFDVIKLDLSGVNMEAGGREKIRRMIKNKMAGGEIIEESVNQMTIQILLRPYEFPLDKLLLRMATMTHNMILDIGKAIDKKDKNILKDVIDRDEDVDKFYFMGGRWLTNMIGDQSALQNYGLKEAKDCLEYRIAFRHIERVADHVNRIASKILEVMDEINEEQIKAVGRALEGAGSVFTRAVNCLQSGSLQEANRAIHDARKVIGMAEELMDRVVDSKLPTRAIGAMIIIIESIKRIGEYGIGISEIAFNLHVTT
jgi:phosphate uptake regulator